MRHTPATCCAYTRPTVASCDARDAPLARHGCLGSVSAACTPLNPTTPWSSTLKPPEQSPSMLRPTGRCFVSGERRLGAGLWYVVFTPVWRPRRALLTTSFPRRALQHGIGARHQRHAAWRQRESAARHHADLRGAEAARGDAGHAAVVQDLSLEAADDGRDSSGGGREGGEGTSSGTAKRRRVPQRLRLGTGTHVAVGLPVSRGVRRAFEAPLPSVTASNASEVSRRVTSKCAPGFRPCVSYIIAPACVVVSLCGECASPAHSAEPAAFGAPAAASSTHGAGGGLPTPVLVATA
jgi:hypothetical protein